MTTPITFVDADPVADLAPGARTLARQLRAMADSTGLDAVAELLVGAADTIEALLDPELEDAHAAFTIGVAFGRSSAIAEAIQRLESGFGAGSAPITTIRHHFEKEVPPL